MSTTYADALARHGIAIPDHLVAQAEIPNLGGLQFQGDLAIVPIDEVPVTLEEVPAGGIQVVKGEATANTHWLDNSDPQGPRCGWAFYAEGVTLGYLAVPEGQNALLTHTDEHGSNGIAPGLYKINRQREQADEIRMVAD